MSRKSIDAVRKNITKRKGQKKLKGTSYGKGNMAQATYLQEEEKHGYFPTFTPGKGPYKKSEQNGISPFVFKALLAGILFFSSAILLRMEGEEFQKPKAFVVSALTEEFPFAKVQAWYRTNLGTPFAFLEGNEDVRPVNEQNGLILPVNGVISESFQQNGEGVMISVSPSESTEVTAMNEGTVVFAGKKKETGKTIMIQHIDGTYSIYGNLDEIDVFQYQFVSGNEVIGSLEAESGGEQPSLYFAIQDQRQFIDPVKVIQVDDQK
ncbi:peptidoglycan DD-metalloendopeptidase family protein [Salinibacillus xinjiangensis]|uniref:Peptidoglycan DD-metalloendopeptidase family protein n=1 Tax=Salinibacillus xinjiangensis TaxID=1229268 RepID=A0A6G1XBE7_9BACI|nr:peptidoglycan DD-metalloendopeptidase family protein [Salinibacillus xinjiangensis]MRG88226.1 peptidoglycan DD-metalloendopeptidase family protein [Salinibacillus xinjiangensis]